MRTVWGCMVQHKTKSSLLLPARQGRGAFSHHLAATYKTRKHLQPYMPPSAMEVWCTACFGEDLTPNIQVAMWWCSALPALRSTTALVGHTFRRGQGVHHSGLWLHVAPPISEPRHVSVQWNPYFSNLLITRTLEILFPFPQSNTVTLPRFLKLPYYLNKVLFILNVP